MQGFGSGGFSGFSSMMGGEEDEDEQEEATIGGEEEKDNNKQEEEKANNRQEVEDAKSEQEEARMAAKTSNFVDALRSRTTAQLQPGGSSDVALVRAMKKASFERLRK